MLSIIKTCFNSTDPDVKSYIDNILSEHDRCRRKRMPLLMDDEIPILRFLQESFENSGQFPSESLFYREFPNFPKTVFYQTTAVPVEDFRVYTGNLIRTRLNQQAAICIESLPGIVRQRGISDSVQEKWNELNRITGKHKTPNILLRQNSRDNYNERKTKPLGMKTGISSLDELIFGMDEGTVSVIAGFTSHMKTMFAVNIAYLNAYHYGYNIAYFTLETPKDMMYDQYLARHSYDMKFNQCQFIPHQKIRKCELSDTEQDYLFDVIENDLYEPYIDKDGSQHDRGITTFFDLSDFDTFSFSEISNTLEALDDKLNGNLDAIIVDYVQLCKFMEGGAHLGDDNRIINSYVAYFRKLAQGFRSGKEKKKLIVILLSQINRESWKKASRVEIEKDKAGNESIVDQNGRYDLTCLADANELERGAARVFTTYTNENMKTVREAQVQLLKNRYGATLIEPEKVFAYPEAYVYGEELDFYGQSISGNISQSDLDDALSVLD